MAKAPSESKIPVGGGIPILRSTKGAVRRTVESGIRVFPSKKKLPIIKPTKRTIDNNKQIEEYNSNEKKTLSDTTFDKIPAIYAKNDGDEKDSTFVYCDKIDQEKTFDVLPDLANKTIESIDVVNTKEAKERSNVEALIENRSATNQNQSFTVSGKIIEFRKKLQDMKNKTCKSKPERVDDRFLISQDDQCDSGPYSLLVGLDDNLVKSDRHLDDNVVMENTGHDRQCAVIDLTIDIPNVFTTANQPSSLIEDETMPEFTSLVVETALDSNQTEPLKRSKSANDAQITIDALKTNEKFDRTHTKEPQFPISLIEDESMPDFSSINTNANLDSIQIDTQMLHAGRAEKKSSIVSERKTCEEFRSSPLSEVKLDDAITSTPFRDEVKDNRDTYASIDFIGNESMLSLTADSTLGSLQLDMQKLSLNRDMSLKKSPKSERVVTIVQHNRVDVKDNKQMEVTEYKLPTSKKVLSISKDYDNKNFVLQPLTRKQNPQCFSNAANKTLEKNDIREARSMSNLLSPVSDNSIQEMSKQNSFDESLGILTPEQMDSLSFLENVLSPATDDFIGLQNSDKTTERTNSSTPQTPTEIMKSLTPDGIQSLTKSDRNLSTEDFDPLQQNDNSDRAKVSQSEKSLVSDSLGNVTNEINTHNDTYELFIQRPFKTSTVENLNNGNELCLSVVSHTIDDELLPSVHSSILDALSSIADPTRFDNITHGVRMDQTPSPEELPLDPVDIKSELSALSTDPKTDPSKSVTYSITSITSLDGYQGDGEMSRPVSRGADQSPTIGHRGVNNIQNWQNIPINRRPDPMTDSDFFTESDADGHDEQVHRGDRKAQVIDGALYGGGKNCNPPVLVSRNGNSNDDSCMESSGVFTDMETHRCSPMLLNVIDDLSPEACTTSTRSDLSQNNNSEMYHCGFNDKTLTGSDCNLETRQENRSIGEQKALQLDLNQSKNEGFVSPNRSNEKINKEDKNMAIKKYKMPRRDVASKVKTMLMLTNKTDNQEKQTVPKKEGRWDAVMNKISVNKSESKLKSSLKDIKPKVNSSQSSEKGGFDDSISPNKPKAKITKSRRGKSRMPINMPVSSSRSTPHSSQSDLSVSCSAPPKITSAKHTASRAAKKRDGVTGPGRPLSPHTQTPPTLVGAQPQSGAPPSAYAPSRNRTPPATNGRPAVLVKKPGVISSLAGGTPPNPVTVNNALTKNPTPPRKPIPRRSATQLSPRVQPLKEQNRASSPVNVLKSTNRSGITSSAPPAAAPAPAPPTRDVEALAVLVQYLVFQLDALNAPRWKAQASEAKTQLSEAAKRLQRAIATQRADNNTITQNLNRISELENLLRVKDAHILSTTAEAENKYKAALEESSLLVDELKNLKLTLCELKNDVKESKARVVEAENANKRREAERIALMKELNYANVELEKLKVSKSQTEKALAEQMRENEVIRLAKDKLSAQYDADVPVSPAKSKDADDTPYKSQKSKENKMAAEIESLKTVLDMKMSELGELRKKCEESQYAADQLPSLSQKVLSLSAKVEDLRSQLTHKSEEELNLKQKCKLLEESFSRETAAKNRLSQHNEELKYKLRHNTEVVNYLVSYTGLKAEAHRLSTSMNADSSPGNHTFPGENFIRGHSRTTASFNEKYLNAINIQDRRSEWRAGFRRTTLSESSDKSSITLEKTNSFNITDGLSPPNSPKIKGVVEKSDSVSYVLEIEETPEEMASRLVKRAGSFRSPTSQPTREAIKRQRSRPKVVLSTSPHSLAQSASTSCIEPSNLKSHCKLFRSNSNEHNQFEHRPIRTSTPSKMNGRRELRPMSKSAIANLGFNENKIEVNVADTSDKVLPIDKSCDVEDDPVIDNGDLLILECESVPKESAGEALISGANSEDDSSLDERSHSSSDTESCSDCDKYIDLNGAGERLADPVLQKIAETMDQSLSATPMDVSWSEDGVVVVSESDM